LIHSILGETPPSGAIWRNTVSLAVMTTLERNITAYRRPEPAVSKID
jgi:hypothetical protein